MVPRAAVEDHAAALWQATPPEERTTSSPPTIEEMMVPGTPAAELLTALTTVEQQPHVVYPRDFQTSGADACQDAGSGHRRAQLSGESVQVIIETHAPSPRDASDAQQHLVSRLPGASVQHCGRRRLQLGGDHLHTADVCGLGSHAAGCTELGQTTQARHTFPSPSVSSYNTCTNKLRQQSS